MTDYYKISLEILLRLLREAETGHWEEWIKEDIHLWTEQKRVDHHLGAYGGMGSINDLNVGGSDTIGVWKNKLFEIAKTLSWSLAKGKIIQPSLDENFYRYGTDVISGWRCRNCGHSKIDKSNTENVLATYFLPKLFVEYIKLDKLIKIGNLDEIIYLSEIKAKRVKLEQLIIDSNIELTVGNGWDWICPKCNSKETCVYRWQTKDNESQIIESPDNIKML